MSQKQLKLLRWIATVMMGLVAVVFILPTVLTFTNSLMATSEISANYGRVFANASGEGGRTYIAEKVNLKFIPDMVSFDQYKTVLLQSPDYLLKFWNSMLLTVPIVAFQLVIACLAAYGFMRFRGRLKELVFFAYIVLMLMPYQVTLVPNYLVVNWLNIIDTRWSIILPGIFAPLSVFILTKYMRRIPAGIIEAAKLDGAGEWQIFSQVCIPMCKNVLFSVVILVFLDYWNMVEQPLLMLKDEAMHPLSVFLSKINTGDTGLAFAVATIYMMPPILLFLYGEEYLIEGITISGGIKG